MVALADEIAQQTHDLEDGLYAEAVSLDEIEKLAAAVTVIEHAGERYRRERRRWRKAAMLQRGLIHLFVTDADPDHRAQRERVGRQAGGSPTTSGWLAIADDISATTVAFSRRVATIFAELKAFIYRFIINHQEVNRQDHRAHLVMSGLFRAYYGNPLTLPTYVLLRVHEETGRPYLRDLPIKGIPGEVAKHYHTDPRFVRLIVDHLAGMSDRYAIDEYKVVVRSRFRTGPGRGREAVTVKILMASDHAGFELKAASGRARQRERPRGG